MLSSMFFSAWRGIWLIYVSVWLWVLTYVSYIEDYYCKRDILTFWWYSRCGAATGRLQTSSGAATRIGLAFPLSSNVSTVPFRHFTVIFRGRVEPPFNYFFICWNCRLAALMLCYHSTAPCTCKTDISNSFICHLLRFISAYYIGRLKLTSFNCFGSLSYSSLFITAFSISWSY